MLVAFLGQNETQGDEMNVCSVWVFFLAAASLAATERLDPQAFLAPSQEQHPETWFHFIGGNVSKPGITADLEAIKRAGISGVQFFHGQFGGPWPNVSPQIQPLSEKWDETVAFLGSECERLGLRLTVQNCPGWSMSGGPWIEPSNAMRHLTFSRTEVRGGRDLTVPLPLPKNTSPAWRDYRDVCVLAFPSAKDDSETPLRPTASGKLADAFAGKRVSLAPCPDEGYATTLTFETPVSIRTLEMPSPSDLNHGQAYTPGLRITVEAKAGDAFATVADEWIPQGCWQDHVPHSIACDERTSQEWRVTLRNQNPIALSFLRVYSAARKDNWEGLAAWTLRGLSRKPHPQQSRDCWIAPETVLDLSSCMEPDGTLRWTAPAGDFTILRIGHVNTGKKNGPAPKEGKGWECNKLAKVGMDAHFPAYVGRLKNEVVRSKTFNGLLVDSWECERQTWTDGLDALFEKAHGYPLRNWLPAVFGWVVGTPETTERFLLDWRRTISDLCVQNYYGRMAELAHKNGLEVQFETAFGDVFPGDLLEFWKYADTPMCEFWNPQAPAKAYLALPDYKPVIPCVSAARMYGKRRVAAEAFTSTPLTWNEKLRDLKPVANRHFAKGVTHLVFHTYTHNPSISGNTPGSSFGCAIGTPFLRTQTWWKHMPRFTDYIARCGVMLEAGFPVSDVLWYLGDELGHKPSETVAFPDGYKYDFCNYDALLNRIKVKNGKWRTPEGIEYALLWLPDTQKLRTETLTRIRKLLRAGGVAAFERLPSASATLSGGAETEKAFKAFVQEFWSCADDSGFGTFGRGRLYIGRPLNEVLRREAIQPDVLGSAPGAVWNHRRDDKRDWYFVAVDKPDGFNGTLDFRAAGKVWRWNPETGAKDDALAVCVHEGRTSVALSLPPSGSCFLVFERDAKESPERIVRVKREGKTLFDLATGTVSGYADAVLSPGENGTSMIAWTNGLFECLAADGTVTECKTRGRIRSVPLPGTWNVEFPDGMGARESYSMNPLIPWKDLQGTREASAYSGTAKYTLSFVQSDILSCERFLLDLGRVESIARVTLNGRTLPTLWCEPYRLDVTRCMNPGINVLTIGVTDTWFNRLVYDAGVPEKERKTWTIGGPKKDAPFRDSGLLGPVVLRIGERLTAE